MNIPTIHFVASFLGVFLLAVAPPLIVRFTIVRHPLSKGLSITLAVINIALFTALVGERWISILFCAALLSYPILREPVRQGKRISLPPQGQQGQEQNTDVTRVVTEEDAVVGRKNSNV